MTDRSQRNSNQEPLAEPGLPPAKGSGVSDTSDVPLLEADQMGRRGRGGIWLFRHVCLTVRSGDCWSVQGPSGSGKTLMFRALAQLDPLDEGRLLRRGRVVNDSAIPHFRSRVMYVHQNPRFLEGSVEENLFLPFRLSVHGQRRWDEHRILAWLKEFDRDAGFLPKAVDELSGGEVQMVSLLRALQLDPEVLLLDEPTAAMDRKTADAAQRIVLAWLQEDPGRAVMWITHRRKQAETFANKTLVLEQGQILSSGTPETGFTEPDKK